MITGVALGAPGQIVENAEFAFTAKDLGAIVNIMMVETGISWWDGMYTRLPGGARFEIEMQWGSIGWAVPAAFGYSVGLEADRRLVAAIGDGSFQLTAQEVSNMIRHRQEILIFLVNNRGYVIESAIHDGRTGRRDRQSPCPQGRPGPHRMPSTQRGREP